MSAYPFYDPETDGLVYRVVPDPCRAESISDITSETESSASGMTILSEDLPDYFIEHHGRQQPASENAVRWFPADDTRRYILRHVLRKYLFGNNYVGPVEEMLWLDAGAMKRHRVLEIGTKDGTWIQAMAAEFPHVQFLSLDVAPIMAHTPRANIVFEVYDIGKGLLVEDNSQDIVFVNMAIELVRDYRALLVEAHRVLRPGGLIHIHEIAPGLWDSQDDTKLARRTSPIGCHVFDVVRNTITQLGVEPDMCEKLPVWLAPGSDMWKDPNRATGFEQIHTVIKSYPAYPHDGYPCSLKLDPGYTPLLAHFSVICTRDTFGLLRDTGLSTEEANSLVEGMIEELKDPEKCSLLKVYATYGTKRA